LIGTPGTGKTETSRILCRVLGATHVSVSSYAIASCLATGFDDRRDTYVVDLRSLRARLERLVMHAERPVIIEGHYLVVGKEAVDSVFILRTHPNVLYHRLRRSRRHWSRRKILENVAAEYVGTCLAEVLRVCEDGDLLCCEIDTTGRRPGEVAIEILDYLRGRPCKKPPSIDWLGSRVSEELLEGLIKYV